VFTSERGQAFTRFAINKMIETAGRRAGLRQLHPHCLRHTTGSVLANGGMSAWHLQKHLGHANMSKHDRLCADVGRAVEGCVEREAVVLICNSPDYSISRHRISLHELHNQR
jgi:hypothetical protein